MGHVVCIKGISSHFKRWPGFSPPGTPVTHPLVHTPFKEPGTAAPLQPLSTACVCVCACINLGDTAKKTQSDIVSLLSCQGELCTVTYLQRCGGSPAHKVFLSLHCTFDACWINKTPRMIFLQVCQCLVWICFHGHSLWSGGRICEEWDVICQWSCVFVLDHDLTTLNPTCHWSTHRFDSCAG